jgi:DnaJ-class molecular chaperone
MSEATCPACDGDGRIPDKRGGGHHGTCPECGGSGTVTP